MKRVLGLLLCFLLLAAGPAAAADGDGDSPSSTPLERVSAYVEPSIVYLETRWSGFIHDTTNNDCLYSVTGGAEGCKQFSVTLRCTGYVVNPDGYIATAGHCVNPKDALDAMYETAADWAAACRCYFDNKTLTAKDILAFDNFLVRHFDPQTRVRQGGPLREKVTALWAVSAGGVQTGKALPARVVKSLPSDQADGALLKVEAHDLNALQLGKDDLDVGMKVVSIGYPASVDAVADADNLSPSYKDGAISSKKTISGGLLTVYETSAALSGGMSGGPTVNLDGEVVGFNSFTITGETQAFDFIRPAEIVRELLGDAGSTNEVSAMSKAYRQGLDAYFKGDKATAVKQLGKVVEEQPTNQFASDYLAKAKKLKDPPKPPKKSMTGMLVVGGAIVLVLLLVAGAALFLTRRKAPRNPDQDATSPAEEPVTPVGPVEPTPVGHVQPPSPVVAADETPGNVGVLVLDPPAPSPPPAVQAEPQHAPAEAVTEPGVTADGAFCGNCGNRGVAGEKFCRQCGHHF